MVGASVHMYTVNESILLYHVAKSTEYQDREVIVVLASFVYC